MKNIIKMITLSFIFVLLISCTDSVALNNEAVLGTWLLESAAIDGKEEDIGNTKLSYIFHDDGVVLQNTGGSIIDGTYEISGNKIIMTFPGGEFTAVMEQEKLTMEQSNCTYTFKKEAKNEY